MKRILFLQNKILHYRKPLYNHLSRFYKITVLHSGSESLSSEDSYEELVVKCKKIGPFYFQSKVIREARSGKYEVIVAMFDVAWLNTILSIYLKNKSAKFIWWGIGFGKNTFLNWIRVFLSKRGDALLLYSPQYFNSFSKGSINKVFVANNTFYVKNRVEAYNYPNKNILLFIGVLEPRKELNVVIEAFKSIIDRISPRVNFVIVGEGPEKELLEVLVMEKKLESRVFFIGKITETEKLESYYLRAIASVSHGQAGLSVLQSFAYGVPFVTKKNAISGGEKNNIIDCINGFLTEDSVVDLAQKLKLLINDLPLSLSMGKNAYEYYTNNATMENMCDKFRAAIDGIDDKGLLHG